MITPNINQNVLNFTINRFLNEISPVYQINTLLKNIQSISNRLNSSELLMDNIDPTKLIDFGRHMVSNYAYTSYDSFNIGYSQPKLMGYLSETHSNDIDSDELGIISGHINSYLSLKTITHQDASDIYLLLKPHNYILDYNQIKLSDIVKITTTIQLEDTSPSDVSMSNQIFAYETALSVVKNSLNSNVFSISSGWSSFTSYIYQSTQNQFNNSFLQISQDISNFISDDSLFYDNVTNRLMVLLGISHATPLYYNSIKNNLNSIFRNFFINSNTNSVIDYFNITDNQFVSSTMDVYSKFIINELSKSILDSLISKNMLTNIDNYEKPIIKAIYNEYANIYSNIILDIESACSRLSNDSLELLNTHIHLYSGLFSSLDSFISGNCGAFFRIQPEISLTGPVSGLITEFENMISNNSFSTSDINNSKLIDAALSTSLTSIFEQYITIQKLDVRYSRELITPITNIILGSTNYNMSKRGELESDITNIIISEFNSACWLRPADVLLTAHPKFKASFDYTSPLAPIPDIHSMLTQIYSSQQSRFKGDGVLPKLIATSVFNIAMNGNLDEYSIPKPV